MILKQHTITILKNFAAINQGILIKKGKLLRTMSIRKNIFASSPIEDEFDRDFAIYDLNEFLAVISLMGKPDLNFKEEYIEISDAENKTTKIKYFYSTPNVVIAPPDKDISMPEVVDAEFQMTNTQFDQIIKSSNVMRLKNFGVDKSGIRVYNEDSTGNQYFVETPVIWNGTEGAKPFQLNIELLKIISGDYNVKVSSKGIAKFSCTSPAYPELNYFIALDTAE